MGKKNKTSEKFMLNGSAKMVKSLGGARTGGEESDAKTYTLLRSTIAGIEEAIKRGLIGPRHRSLFVDLAVRKELAQLGIHMEPVALHTAGDYTPEAHVILHADQVVTGASNTGNSGRKESTDTGD